MSKIVLCIQSNWACKSRKPTLEKGSNTLCIETEIWNMPTLFEELMLCSEEVRLLFVFVFSLNAKSALSVLKMTAWSADGCCEDDYVYIDRALPRVTLRSIYRTLVTSCYKDNGGMMEMLVPLIPHPNCCIWTARSARQKNMPWWPIVALNCCTTLDAIGAKTRLKMLRRCSGS